MSDFALHGTTSTGADSGSVRARRGLNRALLRGVRQFVTEHSQSRWRMRLEFAGSEEDIRTDSKCSRLKPLGERAGGAVGVDANSAEIAAKARFQKLSRRRRQR